MKNLPSFRKQKIYLFLFPVIFFMLQFPIAQNAFVSGSIVSFSFNLPAPAKTSAGVFGKDGTLIKTLWSNINYNAGTYRATWDEKDEDGKPVTDTIYLIKVLSNNITYQWEGIIGNTSDSFTGMSVNHNFERISSMALAGDKIYAACDYNERMNAEFCFNITNPNYKLKAAPDKIYGQETSFVSSDGDIVYWAGKDPYSNQLIHYVFATKTANNNYVTFLNGQSYTSSWNSTYNSIIDKTTDVNGVITGLAVQKNGRYLFVAHGKLNKINVLNKLTGQVINNISLNNAGLITIDGNDDLWVQAGGNIIKYKVDNNGNLTPASVMISGLEKPAGVGISLDNSIIAVCDGGASQQIKAFNTKDGKLTWVLGMQGGYSSDATVMNDKFFFGNTNDSGHTFITFLPDGSFWFGDSKNYRCQKFSANRTFLQTLMYLPHSRSCSADANNPNRITSDFLEFKIDYTKPLAANNGSWTLVKNWAYNVPAAKDDEFLRLLGTTTLSNNRVYSLIKSSVADKLEIVELQSTGNLRFTGILIDQNVRLYEDGSLRRVNGYNTGTATRFLKRPLTGFDNSGNPVFGLETITVNSPPASGQDPLYRFAITWGLNPAPETSSGLVISYEGGSPLPAWSSSKYHLGAIKSGTNKWLWRTAKSTSYNYNGDYPKDGSYDMGNGVQYPGGPLLVKDKHIFWNYHGEFWKQSQTNKWQHVYDNGLLLGVFGITGRDTFNGKEVWDQEAVPEMAGNTLSAGIVKVGEDYYIYHCDESHHGGVHRWKISGLNTIRIQPIPVHLINR
jgi:hypothetical protein